MAQKSLFKNKKNPSQKAVAVNRHGKVAKTKKGTPSSTVISLHCDADARQQERHSLICHNCRQLDSASEESKLAESLH
jgi:hypothetical protein